MRLATYTQRTATTQASVIAVALLVATILQGSSAILTPLQFFTPQLQPLVTAIWFAMYAVALAGLMLTHGLNWIFWITRYRLLLIILLLGSIASIAWSIDPNVSMQRTVHLLGSSLIAIYLGFMIPLTSILNVFSWVLSFILLSSISVVFLVPELGIEQYEGKLVWRGITASKNTLGFWAATGVLLYYSQMAKPSGFLVRLGYFALAMLALLVLYKTNSATSVLSLVVGGMVALYFFISIRFQLGFVRMGLMAALFSVVILLVLANTNTAELIGRSGDLTGRGEVWYQTWKLILERPLTGYGYGSIWNPNDNTLWIQQSLTDFTWVVYHAHNGFLQIASEIGLPLSFLALLMVIQQLIEIFYCQYDRQQVGVLFVLGFVVAFLVSNYSEARFLVNRELYWIFFIALPISMLRQVDVVLDSSLHDAGFADTEPPDESLAPAHAAAANAPTLAAATMQDDLDVLFEQDHTVDPPAEADRYERFSVVETDHISDAQEDRFDKLATAPALSPMAGAAGSGTSTALDINLESGDVQDAETDPLNDPGNGRGNHVGNRNE